LLGADVVEVGTFEEEFGGTALGRALAVARTVLEGALADRWSQDCH
jgi:hypothetical protein